MIRRVAATLAIGAGVLATTVGPAYPQAPLATREAGVLTVGLNLPSQGFQVGATIGPRVVYARGFEVDLARAVAKRMGLRRVDFVQQPQFAAIVAAGTKPWDLAFAQTTTTASRKRAVSFSVPYLSSDQGVLLRRGLPSPQPASLSDLKRLRLCVQTSTTSVAVTARRIAPEAPARRFDDRTNLLAALQTGRCDAVVLDAAILSVHHAATPERYGVLLGRIPTGERYAAVLERDSRIVAPVNRALNTLRRDGTIDRLIRRWLTTRPQDLPAIPTGATAAGGRTEPVRPPVPLP